MMGILRTFAASQTIFNATGRIAGPLRPPTIFARRGLRVSGSIDMPINVFINETASAPDSSAASAGSFISITFGDNLMINGSFVAERTASVYKETFSGI